MAFITIDSRMFDLLRAAKQHPDLRHVPFVCYRDLDSDLSATLLQSMEIACKALGAAMFIDLHSLKKQLGVEEADREFCSHVRDCFPPRRYSAHWKRQQLSVSGEPAD